MHFTDITGENNIGNQGDLILFRRLCVVDVVPFPCEHSVHWYIVGEVILYYFGGENVNLFIIYVSAMTFSFEPCISIILFRVI